ncbi:MAG: hypoxanthine phosphoribosyltransferase, partial [Gammaproteobacteria bacterium]|nr:hypoxanthine phosphoribosyltransferase [Gammaproteobacteria bacterium]
MSIKPHRVETLISEADVRNRLKAIARELDTVYATGEPLVMVGLLRGSFIVQADLSRAMQTPHEVDFMVVSSYGNSMESSREVKVIKDLETEIHDKHVLVVEDIIDT